MGAPGDCAEAEVIFNRASLALAKSQRLIASWLPPKSQVAAAIKTEEELDREESEIFSVVPERYHLQNSYHSPVYTLTRTRLGLGAPVPEVSERQPARIGSQSARMDDKLRKQMLSRNTTTTRPRNSFLDTDPRSVKIASTKRQPHDKNFGFESEDEDGRTTIKGRYPGRIKHHSDIEEPPAATTKAASLGAASENISNTSHTTFQKKRPNSYLDEVLLARSVKRKNKGRPVAVGAGASNS